MLEAPSTIPFQMSLSLSIESSKPTAAAMRSWTGHYLPEVQPMFAAFEKLRCLEIGSIDLKANEQDNGRARFT